MAASATLYLDPGEMDADPFYIRREAVEGGLECISNDVVAGEIDAVVFDGYNFALEEVSVITENAFTVAICDGPSPAHFSRRLWHGFASGSLQPGDIGGPRYTLLKHGYSEARQRALCEEGWQGGTAHVLVAMGAVDSANATHLALRALENVDLNMEVIVLLPDSAPHSGLVDEYLVTHQGVRAAEGVDLDALYRWADVAIGAPGMALLERAAYGVPTLFIEQNQMQAVAAKGVEAAGVGIRLGRVDSFDPEQASERIARVFLEPERLDELRRAGLHQIDGMGAERVASWLMREAENWFAIRGKSVTDVGASR